ncbi:MAG: hypothetical protein ACRENK_11140 [Gemmatimonadaceae bacterium]
MLISLGCDPAFISDVFGDLSEEYADRSAHAGVLAAKWWYVREILRSAPHVIWGAIRNGSPAARAKLAAYTLAAIVTLSLIAIAWVTRDGPPARLDTSVGYSDGIVVNNVRPVQLSMAVLDAAGHRLEGTDVRYRRVSGVSIPVSTGGVIQCKQRGDAVVRASLATLNKDFVIHCEPIRALRSAAWGNFVVGESARTLSVDALGLDGHPVTRIAARLRVDDSTIATLDGDGRLRPLRPGDASIDVEIGDRVTRAEVTVFERVRTFEGLRPDQRWVVAPIHLTRGASLRWPLPTGRFFLSFSADSSQVPTTRGFIGLFGSSSVAQSPIGMTVAGPITCTRMPEPEPEVLDAYCLARAPGATVHITAAGGRNDIFGSLGLERQEQH